MILGIVGLATVCCSFGVPSLIAVILGHVALREIRASGKGGHGMAVAGLTTGYITLAPAIALSIWVVFAGGLSAIGAAGTPSP
jgi:hypothetical protein